MNKEPISLQESVFAVGLTPACVGDVFLTGTDLSGRFVLRACIVNFRTTEEDGARLVNVFREVGQRVAAQSSQAS